MLLGLTHTFLFDYVRIVIERNKSLKKTQTTINSSKKIIKCIQHNETDLTDRREITEAITEFYDDLYARRDEQDSNAENNEIDENDEEAEEDPDIIKEEVILALKEMKNNRAPGEDEITSELLKAGGEILIQKMTVLFNQILDKGYVPKIWKNADIVLLHKKGCQKQVKNYRPITLLSHLSKTLAKIIQRRIQWTLDRNQPREQAGFRKHFSTIDHIHSIN